MFGSKKDDFDDEDLVPPRASRKVVKKVKKRRRGRRRKKKKVIVGPHHRRGLPPPPDWSPPAAATTAAAATVPGPQLDVSDDVEAVTPMAMFIISNTMQNKAVEFHDPTTLTPIHSIRGFSKDLYGIQQFSPSLVGFSDKGNDEIRIVDISKEPTLVPRSASVWSEGFEISSENSVLCPRGRQRIDQYRMCAVTIPSSSCFSSSDESLPPVHFAASSSYLRLWEARNGRLLAERKHQIFTFFEVKAVPWQQWLCWLGYGEFQLCDVNRESLPVIHEVKGHDTNMRALEVYEGKKMLVTGCCSGKVMLWDAREPAVEPKSIGSHRVSDTTCIRCVDRFSCALMRRRNGKMDAYDVRNIAKPVYQVELTPQGGLGYMTEPVSEDTMVSLDSSKPKNGMVLFRIRDGKILAVRDKKGRGVCAVRPEETEDSNFQLEAQIERLQFAVTSVHLGVRVSVAGGAVIVPVCRSLLVVAQ